MSPNEGIIINFFCKSCQQPIRLDSSLLEHSDLDSAMAPIVAEASATTSSSDNSSSASTSANANNDYSSTLDEIRRLQHLELSELPMIPLQDSFVVLPKSGGRGGAPFLHGPYASPLPQQHQLPVAASNAHTTSTTNATTTSSSSDQDQQQYGSLSHRLKIASKFFDIVSGISTVDHPMCQECADELSIQLDKRLSDARKERDAYQSFLKEIEAQHTQLQSNTTTSAAVISEEASSSTSSSSIAFQENITDADIALLAEKEEQALKLKHDLELEHQEILRQLKEAEKETKELDEIEKNYWRDLNKMELDIWNQTIEMESVRSKYEYSSKRLDELKKTNVYNDTFKIWHDGPFGTINGLRLGRLPTQPVDWSEINAALGQTILLLDTLAVKLSFTFKTYKLVPMGSFSRIEKVEGDKATYELYGSGDLKGMLFWNRRFDNALLAFLNCVQQLGDFAEQTDPKFRLPYRISNQDKIGDASIRLQFNQDEAWTKALKYTLIDIKWILAFSCSTTTTSASASSNNNNNNNSSSSSAIPTPISTATSTTAASSSSFFSTS